MENTIKFIDLFAGMGGPRLGLEQAAQKLGYKTECVLTSEIKPYAINALKENFNNEDVLGDIRELDEKELDIFFKEKDFDGINVTIPYKETVIPYLDEISAQAASIKAVNTIVNINGKLIGHNTDYFGMLALIKRNKLDVNNKKVLILGTGGTSKTAYAVLSDLGARQILKASIIDEPGTITYEEANTIHNDVDIIINTTPVGMYPKNDGQIIDLDNFKNVIGVIDVVYNPLRTNLVLQAKTKNLIAEGGLYMLVGQAVYAAEAEQCREVVRYPRRRKGYCLGQPDPFLCHAALHHGQGSSYRC